MAKKKKKTTSKNNLSSKRKRVATKKLAASQKKKTTSKTTPKKNTAPKTTPTKKIEPKIVIEEVKEEPKKIYKVKRKLILSRAFMLVFIIMFIVSLCTNMYVLADTLPFNVVNAEISDKSETTTGTITSFSNDEIINNITFHKVNDYINYKLNIKSNLNKEITILSITDNNTNPYVEYQYDKKENKKVLANSSFELLVRVIYKNELTNITKRNQTNNVKLTIKYLDNNEEKEGTIIINPKTGDHNNMSYILLLISSFGLITCIVVDKKRKNKKLSKLSLFIITGLLISPLVVKAATIAVNIEFKTEIGLYDKMIITYVVDGESKTLANEYNTKVIGLETPTKDGYTFSKWTYEDGSDFDPNEPIKNDIKIIANFTVDGYTISYDLNGGVTNPNNPTTYKTTDRIELVEPTKDYYEFIGWTGTDLEEPTKNVVIENKTGNRSYTANYTPINYTITYIGLTDEEKNTLDNKTEYNIETNSFTLKKPLDRTDSDGDKTELFVGWKEETTTSQTITLPNINSMGNKTFEAIWTPASDLVYSITYELHGGVTSTENRTEFTKKTENFTLVNPTKEGYEFKGWSGTDLDGDENTTVTVYKGTRKDLSFEANYIANNYQIKFEKNGDNVVGSMNNQTLIYDLETGLNTNTYTRNGYTFTGWNTSSDGNETHYDDEALVKNLTSTKDEVISLYAEWEKNSYTIKFNANEPTGYTSEGTMANIDMLYDTPKTLPLNMYTINGYTFDSWNTKQDGTGEKINNGAEVNNLASSGEITLYAKWNINKYQVSFNTDGGSSIVSQTIEHNKTATRPSTDPTKNGYTFDDWYTTSEYTTKFDFTKPITSTTTIYAKFIEESFQTVFTHEGACTFNGVNGVISGDDCEYANGVSKYINTGINLYDSINHDKDYEIGFTIESYNPTNNVNQATFMNTKLEGNNYPGLVFRRRNSTDDLDLSSRKEEKNNALFYTNYEGIKQVKIYRIYNETDDVQEIFYSINNQPKVKINDLSAFNPVFTQSVWFGAAPKDATSSQAQRYLKGTLSNMYIKVGKYQ